MKRLMGGRSYGTKEMRTAAGVVVCRLIFSHELRHINHNKKVPSHFLFIRQTGSNGSFIYILLIVINIAAPSAISFF